MNTRFYNARILLLNEADSFEVIKGELWVKGDLICYVGDGSGTEELLKKEGPLCWNRQIDVQDAGI